MDHPNHKQNAYEQTSVEQYVSSPSAIELREEQQKLKREERRQARLRYDLLLEKIINSIYFMVVTLEVLLGFRFLLQLVQANRENIFARLTYGLSQPFAAPFANLFSNGEVNNGFDGSLLVAMVVYWMLGMMLIWLVGLLRN